MSNAQIIDGNALSAQIRRQVKESVAALRLAGKPVQLTAVLVGSSPAGQMFAQRQGQACRDVGIDYQLLSLDAGASAADVARTLDRLNHDPAVTGIMLHMPLPPHLDGGALRQQIQAIKDVEGVTPTNLGLVAYGQPLNAPFTALAAVELVKSTPLPLRGAEAVVVGASETVGKPAALLLVHERCTVTICRSTTRDLAAHTRRAEILVVAVGKPNFITAEHVRPGAVVIDVGINRITLPDGTKRTVGDVDFDSVQAKAGYLTPVPGGVGPMTVAILLRNTLQSAKILAGV
jgi:methylenetetrahydrofolate dehydrogenase (NADP+)/methenyltetrahydrofolate cyclohydrolase